MIMSKRRQKENQANVQNKHRNLHGISNKVRKYSKTLAFFCTFMFFCTICLLAPLYLIKRPKATYVQQEILTVNTQESFLDMEYRFFLDFSPSMEGFLWEEINSNMAVLADILPRFNSMGDEQRFYYCTNKIIGVDEKKFYASMTGIEEFKNNYLETLLDEGIGEESETKMEERLKETINEIDLSDIFDRRYDDGMTYREGKGDLNLIITDFNFMKEGDGESQKEISEKFANNIAKAAKKCNICIYQIYSKFAGEDIDSIRISENVPNIVEDGYFYIIVLSENDKAYQEFTRYLELELMENGVDTSHKFELLNNFRNGSQSMIIDQSNLMAMKLIEKSNLNFDNKSFKNLPTNAMGMRLVKGQGIASLNMCVAPIIIPGYYNEDATDYSKIETSVRIYNPIGWKHYEEDKGSGVIRSQGADLEWVQEQLYLRLQLELNPDAIKSSSIRLVGTEFFVLDIQFFMKEPSYSLPDWVEAGGLGIDNIFLRIAERKERMCADLEEASRYLGSMIIYVIY